MGFFTKDTIPEQESLFVWGRNGSGKTHLLKDVSNVPELLPALIIDFDKGARTISNSIDNNVVVYQPEFGTTKDFKLTLNYQKMFKEVHDELTKMEVYKSQNPEGTATKYNLIVVDTITSMVESVYREIERTAASKSWSLYDQLFSVIRGIVGALKSYQPRLLYATGWAKYIYDGENIRDVEPRIMGKQYPPEFCNEFDTIAIAYSDVKERIGNNPKEVKYHLEVLPPRSALGAKVMESRDRSGRLDHLVNPTLKEVWEKMSRKNN